MERNQQSKKMEPQKKSTKNPENSKMQETQNLDQNQKYETLNTYQNKLEIFNQKLKSKKRKFNFWYKENISKIEDQKNEIKAQLNSIFEQFEKNKQKKENSDQLISEQKIILIKQEDEKNQLSKSEKSSESVFSLSFQQKSTSFRECICQILDELDEIKIKSRKIKSKIFLYQKQLLKLSDDISPIIVQIYLLQAKIDFEKENDTNQQELKEKTQNTIKAAVAEQQLKIQKMKLQKRIEQMNLRLSEIKSEKSQIKKKLLPKKSNEKSPQESILNTIIEQINQYEEATLRRKNYQEKNIISVHDTISKELEIKIEIDEVKQELDEVKKQRSEMKELLDQKNTEIVTLQSILATSNVEESYNDPLYELINQIKDQREEEIKISMQEPREFSVDESELQEVRNSCDDHYNELKLTVANQLDFNKQMKEAIIKKQKESENQNQNNVKLEISDTPKIILLKKRINEMENEINCIQQKHNKKIQKINKKKEKFDSDFENLDLKNNANFLKSEFFKRFERSMNWLLQAIRSQTQQWISHAINVHQVVGTWDSKIISAVLNEAEDFIIKSSVYM